MRHQKLIEQCREWVAQHEKTLSPTLAAMLANEVPALICEIEHLTKILERAKTMTGLRPQRDALEKVKKYLTERLNEN